MEDVEFDPFNFVYNNPPVIRGDDDGGAAEIPTASVDGDDVSQQTADQSTHPEAEIGDLGARPCIRELSSEDKVLAYQMLLQKSKNGKLNRTATQEVATVFNVKIRSVQRRWKRGKEFENHNILLTRVKNDGRILRRSLFESRPSSQHPPSSKSQPL